MQRTQENVDLNDWIRHKSKLETTPNTNPSQPRDARNESIAVEDAFGHLAVSETSQNDISRPWQPGQESWVKGGYTTGENSTGRLSGFFHQDLSSPTQFSESAVNPTPFFGTEAASPHGHLRSHSEISLSSTASSPAPSLFPRKSVPTSPPPPSFGNTFPHTPTQPPIIVSGFTIDPVWKDEHSRLFDGCKSDAGIVTGDIAVDIFKRSKLDSETLGQIWHLVDVENRGFLDREGFILMMHLIGACLSGHESKLSAHFASSIRYYLQTPRTGFKSPSADAVDSIRVFTRKDYDGECIKSILPKADEFLKEKKEKRRNFAASSAGIDWFGNQIKGGDPLDDFDDNDLSDDDDIVTHRVNYHRSRVVALVEQRNWAEALVQLNACGFPADVFKLKIVKAMIQNLKTEPYGDALAAATLKDLVYTANYGVHINLLLYFHRALSLYHYEEKVQEALLDCKRGIKLAKRVGPMTRNSLESWARSDIAQLATIICMNNNREADAAYYRTMVQDQHEMHPLLAPDEAPDTHESNVSAAALKAESQAASNFLSEHGIAFNSQNALLNDVTVTTVFQAFGLALERKMPAAVLKIVNSEIPMSYQNSEFPLPAHKFDRIHSSGSDPMNLRNPYAIYPFSFLHMVAAYPEVKQGPKIVEAILTKNRSLVDQCHPNNGHTGKAGSGQSIGSPGNYSPLGMAVVFNNVPVMKTLIQFGASYEFSRTTSFPSSILLAAYLAPRIGSLAPLRYLVSLDPDLTQIDFWENTIFYYIANLGNIKPICKPDTELSGALDMMLLGLGLLLSCKRKDLNLVSKGGETAIDVVRRNQMIPGVTPEMARYYKAVEKLLLEADQNQLHELRQSNIPTDGSGQGIRPPIDF